MAPPITMPAKPAFNNSFFLPFNRFFHKVFNTQTMSSTNFNGFLSHLIPSNNPPNPTKNCPKPIIFFHHSASGSNILPNPSNIIPTVPLTNFQRKVPIVLIPFQMVSNFSIFLGSDIHLNRPRATKALKRKDPIFAKPSKNPIIVDLTNLVKPPSFFFFGFTLSVGSG